MAADSFRCASAARDRSDPLIGSAPQARGWLLLEHPGPWPIDAVAGSGIEPSVLRAVTRAAARHSVRVLLVRPPGRTVPGRIRRWLLVRPQRGLRHGPWTTDTDLLAAVSALAEPPSIESAPLDEAPVLLVCSHGVHDACCAIRGRPVAAALAQRWPGQVWECSHVGGDRFAPNVVVLPDGYYYGRLDPESAVAVVDRHLSGEVATANLRGMAAFPPPVQAGLAAAYERFGPLAPGQVELIETRSDPDHPGQTVVSLRSGDRRATVVVAAIRRPENFLTCRAIRSTTATEYQLVGFTDHS